LWEFGEVNKRLGEKKGEEGCKGKTWKIGRNNGQKETLQAGGGGKKRRGGRPLNYTEVGSKLGKESSGWTRIAKKNGGSEKRRRVTAWIKKANKKDGKIKRKYKSKTGSRKII